MTDAQAFYFDGMHPRGQGVRLRIANSDLIMQAADRVDTLPLRQLTHYFVTPDIIHLDGLDAIGLPGYLSVARSDVDMATWRNLNAKTGQSTPGRPSSLALLSLGAALLAALLIFCIKGLPAMTAAVAPYLPIAMVDRLGAQIETSLVRNLAEREIGDHARLNLCDLPQDHPLFGMMTYVQDASRLPGRLRLQVLHSKQINAFALPGQRVVLTSGLLSWLQSETELAAILAHEIAHLEARDPTALVLQIAVSSGAIGFILGDFAGAVTVASGAQLMAGLHHSRQREQAADRRAIALLKTLSISPSAYAAMLRRLARDGALQDQFSPLLASHPDVETRLAQISSEVRFGNSTAGSVGSPDLPIWSAGQWRDVQSACDHD